jgi:hypothetical protein
MDSGRHKVEVFSAGCVLCQQVIDVEKREVGSSQVTTTKSIGVWSSFNSDTSQREKSGIVILALTAHTRI